MNNSLKAATFAVIALFITACGQSATSESTSNTAQVASADKAATSKSAPSQTPVPPAGASAEFRTSLELFGVRFVVESPNRLAGNTVTVTPSGLKISNDSFTSPANGEVIDAKIGDLNSDQSPEVYVFVRERGGNGRINVIAYGANDKKSMSEFSLHEPDPQSKEYSGYNGSDEFEIVENVLARRFPLFEKKGGETSRNGKTRIVQYKIREGEATWQFYIHRFDEF